MASEPPLDIRAPGANGDPAHERLEAAFAPARPLVEVDGITLVLVTVELWTSKLFVHLAAQQNRATDELDAASAAAMSRWAQRARAAHGREAKPPPPPPASEEWFVHLPLTAADDAGTPYRLRGHSAGGTGTEWRGEWRFEPGVPAAATTLTLAIEGSDGARHGYAIAVR